MNILFVISSLDPGGAERSLAELLPALRDAGHATSVVCLFRRDESLEQHIRESGCDVKYLSARTMIGQAVELRQMLRPNPPDLVHTTLYDADVVGRMAAGATRIPLMTSLVSTSYDPVRLKDPNIRWWRLKAAQAIDAWTARHLVTHFHAITNAVKDAAVRDLRIAPDRITVVERGRDPRRLGSPSAERRTRARRALGLTHDEFVLVTVGRQDFSKGQWILLEAMNTLLADVPSTRLLVVGKRWHASRRIDSVLAASRLNGSVRLLGRREDVPDILAAADLFVFPSLYEGLGGALIEAMALGLPIVASDIPAIREVVEPGVNALLVRPGSAEDLARTIVPLVNDVQRRDAMGARSREIFEARFTLQRSTQKMVALFENVVAQGGRTRNIDTPKVEHDPFHAGVSRP